MNEFSYLIVGWLIGILTMLINKWIESFKERNEKENSIILDCLQFLFLAKDMHNEMRICLSSLHEFRDRYPERRNELERDLYAEAQSIKEREFFPRLMICSFKLQTLQDGSFYELFSEIISKYEKLHGIIVSCKSVEEADSISDDVAQLTKKFVIKSKLKIKKRI